MLTALARGSHFSDKREPNHIVHPMCHRVAKQIYVIHVFCSTANKVLIAGQLQKAKADS